MYYLNDKHPKYEYAIYCRVGNACPYIQRTFTNEKQINEFIKGIVRWHNKYHQIFYIDSEKYKNEYSINMNGTYYKILKRTVNDWEEVS